MPRGEFKLFATSRAMYPGATDGVALLWSVDEHEEAMLVCAWTVATDANARTETRELRMLDGSRATTMQNENTSTRRRG